MVVKSTRVVVRLTFQQGSRSGPRTRVPVRTMLHFDHINTHDMNRVPVRSETKMTINMRILQDEAVLFFVQ